MSSSKNVTNNSSEHWTGRVKWFNNKAGYGFITITDGSRSGSDIFVHHSVVNVENQQYKYLVQGEYVEFDLIKTDSGQHEYQASNVSGIRGGKLMCETRRDLKLARNEYKSTRPEQTTNETRETTLEDTKPPSTTSETRTRPTKTSVTQSRPTQSRPTQSRPTQSRPSEQKKDLSNEGEWTLKSKKGPSNKVKNLKK
jgi:CspA family cold shock protein